MTTDGEVLQGLELEGERPSLNCTHVPMYFEPHQYPIIIGLYTAVMIYL
jgi:hypothetical protein